MWISVYARFLYINRYYLSKMAQIAQKKSDLQASLIDMACRDPDMVSCITRISNQVLNNDFEVKEGDKSVSPTLTALLNIKYKHFFRDCITASYVCGFVPYYIVKENGMRFPRSMPMGSYSWRVRASEKKKQSNVSEYQLIILSGALSESDVHIFEVHTPVFDRGEYEICSPLNGMLQYYSIWKNASIKFEVANEWNSSKHITVTERIDVKDQTTSGIQLLDEQRRYNLTGQHNNVVHDNLLRLTGNGTTASVATAFNHAVITQFRDDQSCVVGSKRAAVHIMPPNTETGELSNMDTGTHMEESRSSYQKACYCFYGLTNLNELHSGHTTQDATAGTNREQYACVIHMRSILNALGREVYAKCFEVDPQLVKFDIRALPRFEINTVADIKLMWEIGMLTPSDMAALRKTIMNQ